MQNRNPSHYPHDPNRWLVSYADFTTMLLALFIVLYAVSQLDIAQMRQFSDSVKNSFSNLELDVKEQRKKLTQIFSSTDAAIKTIPVKLTFEEQVETLKNKLEKAEQNVSQDMSELQRVKILLEENLPAQDQIDMVQSERGLIISLADTVLFDPGSAEIKPGAISTLEKITSILKTLPNPIRVEGHTDNQPIQTQLFPSNWELSTARATSIVKLFIDRYNLSPEKISAAGYGEYRPVATNTTPEGRQKNRRVDIVILSSGSEIFEPDVKKEQ
jgi:chemotaxis protein MotB